MFLNKLYRWLHRNSASAKRQRRNGNAKPTRRRLPLLVEALEDRTVPTVLFAPQFGVESPAQDGGQRINSPNVYVVLWGSSWGSLVSSNSVEVFDSTSAVVSGPYLSGLAQYGVTTTAHYKALIFDNVPDPTTGFSEDSLTAEIGKLITNKQLPAAGQIPNMIVAMVTAPGITSGTAGAAGYNNVKNYGDGSFGYGYIWCGTAADSPQASLADHCSLTFSHEMAEIMTDPGGKGYQVNPGVSPAHSWRVSPPDFAPDQIGDFEGPSYVYRMPTGALVQPYWSALDQAWKVTDGNAQTVLVKPNWSYAKDGSQGGLINYDVTVNGGQLGGADSLIISSVAGLLPQPGILINLNNEFFEFDSFRGLGNLNVTITQGAVHINGSSTLAAITINAHRGTEVDVGTNALINAAVTINDAGSISIGPGNINGAPITVAVNSPHVLTTLTMDERSNPQSNSFLVRGSSIQGGGYLVLYNASQIKNLFVLGGTGGTQVELGTHLDPLDALPKNITVTGGGGTSTLEVNGSGSTDNSYQINSVSIGAYLHHLLGHHFVDSLTNHIFYYNLSGLVVDGNTGTNTFAVNSTHAAPTTLYTHAGANTVQVTATTGPLTVSGTMGSDTVNIGANGTVRNIHNTLLVSNAGGFSAVTVDDSADTARTAIVYNNDNLFLPNIVIDGLIQGGDIVLRGADLKSLKIRASDAGGNIIRIHDTPQSLTPDGLMTTVSTGAGSMVTIDGTTGALALDAQGGGNRIFVGSANGSLTRIQGTVKVTGSGGNNALAFNDQGTTIVQYYYLVADQFTRTDANSVADMAPISFSGFVATTLNVSSGGSLVNVFGSAAGSTVTVNGNAGNPDTFVVQPFANAILGQVIFNGQSADGDFGGYVDSANTAPHTYTLTATTVGREDQAPVSFSGLSVVLLETPLVGGSTVNVKSVSPNSFTEMFVANGDHVTIGSLAPGLGGTLANILGPVSIGRYSPDDAITLVLDDSGDADLTPKNVTLTPGDGLLSADRVEGFAPSAVYWTLGPNSSVSLLGGAADTIFSLQPFVAATPLTIVGGTGSNTLDYSAYATDVTVNLQTGTATDLAGISDPNTGRVTIQNIIGGSGNDTLTAGADRSILIGGGGADSLFGGSGEDILIAGTTDYTQPNLNAAAFDAILQEWNRTDLGFNDRISDLMTGSNPSGVPAKNVMGGTAILLNSSTVHDDGAANVLTGGAGLDWFLP